MEYSETLNLQIVFFRLCFFFGEVGQRGLDIYYTSQSCFFFLRVKIQGVLFQCQLREIMGVFFH